MNIIIFFLGVFEIIALSLSFKYLTQDDIVKIS